MRRANDLAGRLIFVGLACDFRLILVGGEMDHDHLPTNDHFTGFCQLYGRVCGIMNWGCFANEGRLPTIELLAKLAIGMD